jgi:hypothetical protein
MDELEPGIVVTSKWKNISSGEELHVLQILSKPSANSSFALGVLDVKRKDYSHQYWKKNDWAWTNIEMPTLEEQKKVFQAIFSVEFF